MGASGSLQNSVKGEWERKKPECLVSDTHCIVRILEPALWHMELPLVIFWVVQTLPLMTDGTRLKGLEH